MEQPLGPHETAAVTQQPPAAPAGAETPEPDRIHLIDLRFAARIGVHDHEQGRQQAMAVDIEIELPPRIRIDDRITSVVDYDRFRQAVLHLAASRHFNLLETLTEEIARACLTPVPVGRVRVRCRKLHVFPDAGGVAYEVVRSKPDRQAAAAP